MGHAMEASASVSRASTCAKTFDRRCRYSYVCICISRRVDDVHRQAAVSLQGAGRQIGVLVFELAVEG